MGKKRIHYEINLPAHVSAPGYTGIETHGETWAHSKLQAVTQFLRRESPENFKLIKSSLEGEYGAVQQFAEEIGRPSLKSLGLDLIRIVQDEDDLKDGKRILKSERGLLKEYEIARELASRDGVKNLNSQSVRMNYLDRARELIYG